MNECARRSYQIEIEETEVDAMIDEKDKTAEIRKPDVDVRMIQRWPTGRSIFRDNASKHKSRSKRDDTFNLTMLRRFDNSATNRSSGLF